MAENTRIVQEILKGRHIFEILPFLPMAFIYEEICRLTVAAAERYLNDEISLEELLAVEEKMSLGWSYNEWPNMKQHLKNSIFENTLELYNKINDCERLVLSLQKMDKPRVIECNIEDLTAHAMILGRNRAPPLGLEQSSWYLPPFPSIQMIEALIEKPSQDIKND